MFYKKIHYYGLLGKFCKVLLKSYINLAIIYVHEHLIGRMVVYPIFM